MMVLLYYPVSRSNVLAWLFRTDHSTLVRYHRCEGLLFVRGACCQGCQDVSRVFRGIRVLKSGKGCQGFEGCQGV